MNFTTLEGLLKSTGTWVKIAEWDPKSADQDSLEVVVEIIESQELSGLLSLPDGQAANLSEFAAIRAK